MAFRSIVPMAQTWDTDSRSSSNVQTWSSAVPCQLSRRGYWALAQVVLAPLRMLGVPLDHLASNQQSM